MDYGAYKVTKMELREEKRLTISWNCCIKLIPLHNKITSAIMKSKKAKEYVCIYHSSYYEKKH